jgi:DNA-binding PadR family transcriptional regulator
MLLLAEKPAHGYLLLDSLVEMGLVESDVDLSVVYRVLRQLEEDGLAVSDHVDEGRGPARKVYRLTDEGWEMLSAWSDHLKDVGGIISSLESRYATLERK